MDQNDSNQQEVRQSSVLAALKNRQQVRKFTQAAEQAPVEEPEPSDNILAKQNLNEDIERQQQMVEPFIPPNTVQSNDMVDQATRHTENMAFTRRNQGSYEPPMNNQDAPMNNQVEDVQNIPWNDPRNYQFDDQQNSQNIPWNDPRNYQFSNERQSELPDPIPEEPRAAMPQVERNLAQDDRMPVQFPEEQEEQEKQRIIRNNKSNIFLLLFTTIYIIVNTQTVKSSNVIPISSQEIGMEGKYQNVQDMQDHQDQLDQQDQQQNEQNQMFCELDTNSILWNLNNYIFLPTLLFRLYGLKKLGGLEAKDAKDLNTYMQIYFHGTYGSWCLHNIMRFRAASMVCKNQISWSMLNYQLAIIFGLWSAAHVILIALVLTIVIPIIIYMFWKRYRERTAQSRRTKELMKQLISVKYDPNLFKNCVECSICLENFSTEEGTNNMVTPLPCSDLHIFHTKCIKQWLTRDDCENKCPLCKFQLHDVEYKNYAKEFKRRMNQARIDQEQNV